MRAAIEGKARASFFRKKRSKKTSVLAARALAFSAGERRSHSSVRHGPDPAEPDGLMPAAQAKLRALFPPNQTDEVFLLLFFQKKKRFLPA
jgi:hypothetical protein